MAYVYVITNSINDKKYVGYTTFSLEKRFKEHKQDYNNPSKSKRPLYIAMQKYGIDNFEISLLEECDVNEVKEKEKYWIKKLDTYYNGYNATIGGDGKTSFDKDAIFKEWEKLKDLNKVAENFNCCTMTVRKILWDRGISLEHRYDIYKGLNKRPFKGKISVNMIDPNTKEVIQTFSSLTEANQFFNKCKNNGSIRRVLDKKSQTAFGYYWEINNKIDN